MNERPKGPIREPERKPPMKDPPKRKGPLGDPSGDQPVRRDPVPKGPGGQPKEIRDPKVPGRPDEIKTLRTARTETCSLIRARARRDHPGARPRRGAQR